LAQWVRTLSRSARTGDWERAVEATKRLLVQSDHAGSSLAERHRFLEQFMEVTLRAMKREEADNAVLVGTRRLFLMLLRVALTTLRSASS
jgi:hypothetical protein